MTTTTETSPARTPPPSKHQLALMIWLCVFPTLTAINLAFADWLRPMTPALRTFVLATIAVPIVIYGLMPPLHRLRTRVLTATKRANGLRTHDTPTRKEHRQHDPNTVFPLRLTGELDPEVSRWQWLFKLLLAIPHFIVLVFLWIGFVLSTVVAGFAILFTGRYPQSLYDFVLGLNRWVFRVVAYAALLTDTYPPFRLDSGSTEPPTAPGTATPVSATPTPEPTA
jgi:hypothetical protein